MRVSGRAEMACNTGARVGMPRGLWRGRAARGTGSGADKDICNLAASGARARVGDGRRAAWDAAHAPLRAAGLAAPFGARGP